MRFKLDPLSQNGVSVVQPTIVQGGGTTSTTSGVTSISEEGEAALTGAVTLSEGAGISITQTGQDLEIAATGGGGGSIGGSTGSTDNAILRADGTGGATVQSSAVTIDDSGNISTTGTVDGRNLSDDGSKLDGIENGAEVNTVDSVNTQTGVVVLDADDIDDSTTTHKFATAAELADIASNTASRHAALTVTDSSEIDLSLTGQDLTASIIAGSIDETKLDTSVNASLDLADSAIQAADLATVAITGDYDDLTNKPSIPSGDVEGPTSSTDNAIARFDSTSGKLIQNSGVTIDDSNNLGANGLYANAGEIDGSPITTDDNTQTLTNKNLSSSTNTFPDFYPVGTIYINKSNSANPSTYLVGQSGSTWVAIQDKMIMARGSTYTADGGSASHTHGLDDGYAKIVTSSSVLVGQSKTVDSYSYNNRRTGVGTNDTPTTTTLGSELGGSTEAGDNIPPMVVAYVWERTA